MSWATNYIAKLEAGEGVKFRPRGNSMTPLIKSGQEVLVAPIEKDQELHVGDIVLCKVKGKQYLHLITALDGNRVQIGNNHGFINGWTNRSRIYGICIKVKDDRK